jgi:hypothetical protein
MVDKWEEIIDCTREKIEVGELLIRPFHKQAEDEKEVAKEYRLIVKRKPRSDNQLDLFTQDSFDYRAILSNNNDFTTVEVAQFYNRRGNMERQFDILKNDFG